MNVLSLFDGISCGQQALKELEIKVANYYTSEIHLPSIKICKKNFPETILLGDVKHVKASNFPKINLLLGGSPCQGFSLTGKQLNFNDPRSKLVMEYVRILNELKILNPDIKFLLENVCMKKEYIKIISDLIGVEPIKINSKLVSAQSRTRLYWTNIKNITPPKDLHIYLKDVVQTPIASNENKVLATDTSNFNHRGEIKYSNSKSPCLFAKSVPNVPLFGLSFKNYRYATPVECERLQGLPDNYTHGISPAQRYIALGNGWNVQTIKHILSFLL